MQIAVSTKLSQEEKSLLTKKAKEQGFRSVCAYLRSLIQQDLESSKQSVNNVVGSKNE